MYNSWILFNTMTSFFEVGIFESCFMGYGERVGHALNRILVKDNQELNSKKGGKLPFE